MSNSGKYRDAKESELPESTGGLSIIQGGTGGGTGSTDAVTLGGLLPSAFLSPTYVVLAADGNLSSERVLTAGTLISVTDAGANAAVTLALANGGAQYQIPITGASPYTPAWTNMSTLAGAGLTSGSGALAVGAGTLISVAADTVGLSVGSAAYQVPLTGATPFTPGWTSLGALPVLADVGSSDYVSQTTGWAINHGGLADFRFLYATEMHVKAFICDLEQALAGGQIISKSVAIIADPFTIPAKGARSYLGVEDLPGTTAAVFVDGDYVRVRNISRSGGGLVVADAYGMVHFDSRSGTSTQVYAFDRPAGDTGTAATGTVVPAKGLALDYGVSGDGYYEVTTLDAAGSPYAQVVTWDTLPGTGHETVRVRMGNLDGIGILGDEWGLYAAADANNYIKVSDGGLELVGGDGNVILNADGISIGTDTEGPVDLSAYTFNDTGVIIGGLYGISSESVSTISLDMPAIAGKSSYIRVTAATPSTYHAYVILSAECNEVGPSIWLSADSNAAVPSETLMYGGKTTIDQGLIVGTGLYVGNIAGTVVDNCIIADGTITSGTGTSTAQLGAKVLNFYNVGSGAAYITVGDDTNTLNAISFTKPSSTDAPVTITYGLNVGGVGAGATAGQVKATGRVVANSAANGYPALGLEEEGGQKWYLYNDNTDQLIIQSGTPRDTITLTQAGATYHYSNADHWAVTSDERLKTGIRDLDGGAVERIGRLRPRSFAMKDTGVIRTGFVAQEFAAVFPEAVTLGEDGYYRQDTSCVHEWLVRAVQELAARLMLLGG